MKPKTVQCIQAAIMSASLTWSIFLGAADHTFATGSSASALSGILGADDNIIISGSAGTLMLANGRNLIISDWAETDGTFAITSAQNNITFSPAHTNEGDWALLDMAGSSLLLSKDLGSGTNSLTLDHVILSNGAARALNVTSPVSGKKFVLKGNVVFLNNSGALTGGAVQSGGDAIFTGTVVFQGNRVGYNAAGDTWSSGIGGAFYQTTTGIYATTFEKPAYFFSNTAANGGGAIYTMTGNSVVFENKAVFKDNMAGAAGTTDASGGAIFFYPRTSAGTLMFKDDAVFDGNTSALNGGAVLIRGNQGTQAARFMGSSTFINNIAETAEGGAVSIVNSQPTVIFYGHTIFIGNTAATHGGGLSSAIGKVTFSGTQGAEGTIVEFSNNTALGSGTGQGGGIFANTGIDFTGALFSVTGNSSRGQGGGVATSAALTIAGDYMFTQNQSVRGGAVYAKNITLNGSGTVASNISSGHGGAFYVLTGGVIDVRSGAVFENNSAGGSGGAIYAENQTGILLDASTADIVFSNNMAGATVTPDADGKFSATGGQSEAVYFANTGSITINAAEGHSVRFLDSIAGSATSSVVVTKTGEGVVVFDKHHSNIALDTTVLGGEFRLTQGAVYGADSGTGAFTLSSNATLAGNGTIRADAISIHNGSTLEVIEGGGLTLSSASAPVIGTGLKLGGSGTISAGSALNAASVRVGEIGASVAQKLTLTNDLTLADGTILQHDLYDGNAADQLAVLGNLFLVAGGTYTIDLGAVSTGTFTLVTWQGSGLAVSDTARFSITANGVGLTSARNRASISINDIAKELLLINKVSSLGLTWTGSENGVWTSRPATAANWTDGAATVENFFHSGDSVLFDGDDTATNRVITLADEIDASQVRIIGSATHTFTGDGSIKTDAASMYEGSVITTGTSGKLIKEGAGVLAFENTGTNSFVSGIDHSGGVISVTRASQIETGTAAIKLSNAAILRAAAAIPTLSSNINVAASNDTGVLDIGAFDIGYSGALTGSGTLIKTGSGALLFSSASSSVFAGAVRVDRGALLLGAGASLGGNISASSADVVIGGAGTFGGNVSITNGLLCVGGLGTSSTLSIGGTLSLHNATLSFGLHPGLSNDALMIGAGGTLSVSGSNNIDITAPEVGVYMLGNVAGLSGATVTIAGQTQIDGGRQSARVSGSSNGNLYLTFNADQSRVLTWNGSIGNLWNNADNNWAGTTNKFASGDTVNFLGTLAASHTISIVGSGVTVSDMIVDASDNYTFTDAGITARADSEVAGDSAEITDARGKLVKSGAGTLTFANAANNFTGGIDLSGGVLAFSAANQISTGTSTITFTGNSTLRVGANEIILGNNITIADGITAFVDTGANTFTLSGTLFGASGTLAKIGAGTLIYSGSAALKHANTRIDGGIVVLRDIAAAATPSITHNFIFNGGWLDLSDTPYASTGLTANDWRALSFSGSLGGIIGSNDKITLRAGDHAFGIGSPTNTSKQGVFIVVDAPGGVVTMTGSNNYVGYTMLKSGTLRVSANNQLGMLSANREVVFDGAGATLELANGFASARAIDLRQNGAINVATSSTATWSGAISGAANTLSKTGAGTLVLGGVNPATLNFAVAAGTLRGNTNSLKGNIAVSQADATVIFDQATNGTYAGVVSGAGNFEKNGAGILTLSHASTNSGATRIQAGTLKAGAANTLNASSAHAVAPGATLDLAGFAQTVASLAANGTVIFDASYNAEEGLIDRANILTVTGALTGSGTMFIRLIEAPAMLTGGKSINIISSGAGSDTSQLKAVLSEDMVDGIYDVGAFFDSSGKLTLVSTIVSPEIPAATAIPTISLLMGQTGLDSVGQRLGQLREDAILLSGLWARGIYREDSLTDKLFKGMEVRITGFQVGDDQVFENAWGADGSFRLGAYIDFFECQGTTVENVKIDGRQRALGFYGTLNKGTWFIDAMGRVGRTEYNVNTSRDHLGVEGDVLAFTLESGWRFDIGKFGQIEPSAQVLYLRQKFDDSADRFNRDYRFGPAESIQVRGGIGWSKTIRYDTISFMVPWLRVSGGSELKADQKLYVSGVEIDNDMGGTLVDLEGGLTFTMGKHASLYMSGQYRWAKSIDTTVISAGLRLIW